MAEYVIQKKELCEGHNGSVDHNAFGCYGFRYTEVNLLEVLEKLVWDRIANPPPRFAERFIMPRIEMVDGTDEFEFDALGVLEHALAIENKDEKPSG